MNYINLNQHYDDLRALELSPKGETLLFSLTAGIFLKKIESRPLTRRS